MKKKESFRDKYFNFRLGLLFIFLSAMILGFIAKDNFEILPPLMFSYMIGWYSCMMTILSKIILKELSGE